MRPLMVHEVIRGPACREHADFLDPRVRMAMAPGVRGGTGDGSASTRC